MTPAQILSHLSPQERTDALAKFLQIENFDYSGMTREDHDIVQLGHYTELHDELIAKARASLELDRERAAGARVIRQATPNHLLFNGTGVVA
ncbi:hypothetical protein RA280_15200 [Cupriavidus sp. CV2]|uniref:hypothetical protein n=1 Tax=Cupriavidus ulmosensis TaxID=3065913 RepID=UPI00296ACCE0|nr:hypothetical protein [Cupriavidus sp. CV2]MDW3683071.1 hypothetical protein [Cupriavidus sp. CV2]